jgi:DNA-binding NarL/FixJ family response regulator
MESAPSEATAALTRPVRVIVVDDQRLLCEGIASLLANDQRMDVVGIGSNGEEAVRLSEDLHPDVVLMDIRMPVMDGIQATRVIKNHLPDVHVVILTSYVYDGYVVEGLMAGADGYLLKDSTSAALVSSIVAVVAGQKVMEPHVTQHVGEVLSKQSAERVSRYDGLTQRELQLVAMIARGMVAKEIAHELQISDKTVRNHISNIYHKLGIFDRSQAVLYAVRKGLVVAD